MLLKTNRPIKDLYQRDGIERLHRPKSCKIILPGDNTKGCVHKFNQFLSDDIHSDKKSLRLGTSTCLVSRLLEFEKIKASSWFTEG